LRGSVSPAEGVKANAAVFALALTVQPLLLVTARVVAPGAVFVAMPVEAL
jgi:hypothetical protein